MDLGTIKRGIEGGKYETIDEIANDIRLVWSNCMLYNRDGSEVSIHSLIIVINILNYINSILFICIHLASFII